MAGGAMVVAAASCLSWGFLGLVGGLEEEEGRKKRISVQR
jgi:hypothetical protein